MSSQLACGLPLISATMNPRANHPMPVSTPSPSTLRAASTGAQGNTLGGKLGDAETAAIAEDFLRSDDAKLIHEAWFNELQTRLLAEGFVLTGSPSCVMSTTELGAYREGRAVFVDPITQQKLSLNAVYTVRSSMEKYGRSVLEATLDCSTEDDDYTDYLAKEAVVLSQPRPVPESMDVARRVLEEHVQAAVRSNVRLLRWQALNRFVAAVCARQSH